MMQYLNVILFSFHNMSNIVVIQVVNHDLFWQFSGKWQILVKKMESPFQINIKTS